MNQYIVIICIFGAVGVLAYWVMRLLLDDTGEKLRQRLSGQGYEDSPDVTRSAEASAPLLNRLGEAAAEPFMPKDGSRVSTLRRSLARAGIYSPSAARIMIGFKFILLMVGLIGGYAVGLAFAMPVLGLSLGGLVGYLAPQLWLKLQTSAHQKELNYSLPDALDLMVVCIEAGLTIDSAMQRVGEELSLAHPRLSRELEIAHMETRVGLSRSESLKNLATRTNNAAVTSLVAMMVQAERFGTSIAQALRVHADCLRTARQQAAEEIAGRASVKMSFPLVLFIFPATFIVLAGPAVLNMLPFLK
ncbi:MAG: type II secretion system F family protein [Phycisphaerales bacterium]|nr:type II secretion system F family protein [Phycisphaerales bacterium]